MSNYSTVLCEKKNSSWKTDT